MNAVTFLRCHALLFAVALLGFVSSARAQQTPALPQGVRLVLSSCDTIVSRKALLDQLRIELLSTGVIEIDVIDPETGTSRSQGTDRIATVQVYFPECDDEAGLVNLRVSDRLTSKYVERSLMVSDISAAIRPRAIALAIVELLRASWLELVLTNDEFEDGAPESDVRNRLVTHLKERTTQPEAPPPFSAADVAREQESARRVAAEAARDARWKRSRLEWLAGGRIFPQGNSGDVSTTINASLAMNQRIRLHVGGLAAGGGVGGVADTLGNLSSFEAAGRVALGLGGGDITQIEVAPCVEVGYAKLSAGPTDLRDTSGAIAIGSIHATIRTDATKGVDVLIGVQAGYVFAPLEIKEERKTIGGFVGPMMGVTVGLSGIL